MRIAISMFIFFTMILLGHVGQACESCMIGSIGHKERVDENKKARVTAKVVFEHQDWKEAPADALHTLHHQGKHVHDKQDEEIIHTILTAELTRRLSIDMDIPYVTKHYIEVDSHPNLGSNQTSKGLGDMIVTGDYRLIKDEGKSFGIIAGLKLPTGKTNEQTSFGALAEPELQPGSGSLDYIGGISGSVHPGSMDFSASAIYIYRTEGKQDFRAGDVLSISLNAGRTFELAEKFKLKVGAMLNNQLEKKENDENGFIKDSGGYTMLVGPQVILSREAVSVEFSYLFPAVQNLGGVHQELDKGIWTTSVGVKF